MRKLFSSAIFLVALFSQAAFGGAPYPADYSPQPVLSWSTAKFTSSYSGFGLAFFPPAGTPQRNISFSGDLLDASVIDGYLAGQIGSATFLVNQMPGAYALQSGIPGSPSIATAQIGPARTLVFRGGSQSGALFSLNTPDVSALAIPCNTWTMMAVVQPTSSTFVNQAGAPGVSVGTLFNFTTTGGNSLSVVNDAQSGGRGAWAVTDGGAFNFSPTDTNVPINPQVLTVSMGATNGTRICVNENCRTVASRPTCTGNVNYAYLGKMASSVAGATSKAGDFRFAGAMIWKTELTDAQVVKPRSALYERFSIRPETSSRAAYQLVILGDSIGAGYNDEPGICGYACELIPALANQKVRVLNYAIPGSTVTVNPLSGYAYTSTSGQFATSIAPNLADHSLGSTVVIHGGGNDSGIGPPLRSGTTHSNTTIDGFATVSDIAVGNYVFAANLPNLTRVTAVNVGTKTITIDNAATSSATLNMWFASASPEDVANGIKDVSYRSLGRGAKKVIAVSVLPRSSWDRPYGAAINALLAAATDAPFEYVDCASYGNLATNPGVDYADSAHPSRPGFLDLRDCLLPALDASLVP